MKKLHIWKEEPVLSEGFVTAGAIIEEESGSRRKLWYRVPDRFADDLSESCNAFTAGAVYTAMREARDLVVHGIVSRKLLENLEEFQSVWAMWRPDRYKKIEISADTESDDYIGARPDKAIATFSGGVDGSFTVYRHHKDLVGRGNRNLTTGMFIHGFNISLDREDIFGRAFDRAEIMMSSLGIDLMRIATNFRDLGDNFSDAHAAQIASCMLLFENIYSIGLIASTEPYNDLTLPWGSNPVTDRLLSSDRMEFIHDGAAFTRCDKIETISDWKEALEHLRVCWQADNLDKNCCKCEKCIRTILNFRVLGVEKPECFDMDATDGMIGSLKSLNDVAISFLQEILDKARERSVKDSWVSTLEKTVKRNRKARGGWRRKIHDMRNRYAIKTRLKQRFSK